MNLSRAGLARTARTEHDPGGSDAAQVHTPPVPRVRAGGARRPRTLGHGRPSAPAPCVWRTVIGTCLPARTLLVYDSRAMNRAGAIVIACAIGVLPVATSQIAQAARPQTLATARVAATLARIVRQDARQQAKRSRPTLTVTEGCCGQRTLRIHYAARSQPPVVHDNYVLRLETKRGVMRGVAISESTSEIESLGADSRRIGDWTYELAVHQQSPGRAGWRYTISYESKGSTIRPPGQPSMGGGAFRECAPRSPVPVGLYREMLLAFKSARRHISSASVLRLHSHC
jgi:hypothetical protein